MSDVDFCANRRGFTPKVDRKAPLQLSRGVDPAPLFAAAIDAARKVYAEHRFSAGQGGLLRWKNNLGLSAAASAVVELTPSARDQIAVMMGCSPSAIAGGERRRTELFVKARQAALDAAWEVIKDAGGVEAFSLPMSRQKVFVGEDRIVRVQKRTERARRYRAAARARREMIRRAMYRFRPATTERVEAWVRQFLAAGWKDYEVADLFGLQDEERLAA